MIIRARQKPLSDIPAELTCCDYVRQRLAIHDGIEFELDTETVIRDLTCSGCGAIHEREPMMRIAHGGLIADSGATLVALRYLDLDEGLQP